MKTVWSFHEKLKIELPYDPAIPLLGIYRQNYNLKKYMQPYAESSTIYNSQDMEALKCPSIDEWIKKMWYI